MSRPNCSARALRSASLTPQSVTDSVTLVKPEGTRGGQEKTHRVTGRTGSMQSVKRTSSDEEREGRGSGIRIDPGYLKLIRQELAKRGYESLGEIASAADTSRPTIKRFFDGQTSDDMAERLCRLAELPYPVISITHPDDPQWIYGAQALRQYQPDLYAELLPAFHAMALAKRESDANLATLKKIGSRLRREDPDK